MSGARIWRISDSSDNHRRCLRTLLSLGRVSKLSMSNAYESYVHLPTPGAACAAPDAHSHNTPVEHGEDGLAGQAHANCNDGTEHMGLPSRVTLTKAEVASAHLVSLRALVMENPELASAKSVPASIYVLENAIAKGLLPEPPLLDFMGLDVSLLSTLFISLHERDVDVQSLLSMMAKRFARVSPHATTPRTTTEPAPPLSGRVPRSTELHPPHDLLHLLRASPQAALECSGVPPESSSLPGGESLKAGFCSGDWAHGVSFDFNNRTLPANSSESSPPVPLCTVPDPSALPTSSREPAYPGGHVSWAFPTASPSLPACCAGSAPAAAPSAFPTASPFSPGCAAGSAPAAAPSAFPTSSPFSSGCAAGPAPAVAPSIPLAIPLGAFPHRQTVAGDPQPWYRNLTGFGNSAVQLLPWATIVQTAPRHYSDLRARPLATDLQISKELLSISKAKASFPRRRQPLYSQFVCIFTYYVIRDLSEGVPYGQACAIGNHELFTVLISAVGMSTFLSSVSSEAARCVGTPPADIVLKILSAIDLHFRPTSSSTFIEWAEAKPKVGETFVAYFDRLRMLASDQGRPPSELFDRFKSGLQHIATSHALLVASNFVSKFDESTFDPADAASHMVDDPIYQMSISSPTAPPPPDLVQPGLLTDPLSLVTRARQAYDLKLLYGLCDKLGNALGDVPPCTVSPCAICAYLGVKDIGAWGEDKARPQKNEKYSHNPWYCTNLPRFADAIITKYPDTSKDDLLRPIDNPTAVSRA